MDANTFQFVYNILIFKCMHIYIHAYVLNVYKNVRCLPVGLMYVCVRNHGVVILNCFLMIG